MDDLELAKNLIESFEQITNVETFDSELKCVSFYVESDRFLLLCPVRDKIYSKASVFTMDNDNFGYPHITTEEVNVLEGKALPVGRYRSLCLYESGSIVQSLYSYEEKIIEAIERLLKLVGLSSVEVEQELQKEFLYYWNESAKEGEIEFYLGKNGRCTILNVYYSENAKRCVAPGIYLNDKDKKSGDRKFWTHKPDIIACYVPITDARGIIPPTKGKEWTGDNVIEIVYGKQINHISHESFEKLSNYEIKTNKLILAFGINVEGMEKVFSMVISFNSAKKESILTKLQHEIIKVEIIKSKRNDYNALNEAIGNDTALSDKKVLVVGAGSLGSYVSAELIKNGFRTITVYDGDTLEAENTMRWAYGGFGQGLAKPVSLKLFLEFLHPEINVNAIANDLNPDSLKMEIEKNDLILFTIGNSDKQLMFNQLLKEYNCKIPVFYSWIEAGGEYSHILKVEYEKRGCFQCLYTEKDGTFRNNKANIVDDIITDSLILRNGCGGTRAPYGTSVLLRTTAALLKSIQEVMNGEELDNYLLNISSSQCKKLGVTFYERKCTCCGDSTT